MRFVLLAAAAAAMAGCGYVGDPLPPALHVPQPVEDLTALQRGGTLLVSYTAPGLTTEDIGITKFAAAELRVGEGEITIPTPEPGQPARVELPAVRFAGQALAMTVILAGPKGRRSEPSNTVIVQVVEPLRVPAGLQAEPHPDGVRLTWTNADARPVRFRVQRAPESVATVDQAEYIDRSVEIGKEYRYTVVSFLDAAESEPSEPRSVIPRDVFAPNPPANLTAIAGLGAIELGWERSAAPDLKGYRVYRDGELLAEDVGAPSFSDGKILSGQRYRYSVSAVDENDNESKQSDLVEIVAP